MSAADVAGPDDQANIRIPWLGLTEEHRFSVDWTFLEWWAIVIPTALLVGIPVTVAVYMALAPGAVWWFAALIAIPFGVVAGGGSAYWLRARVAKAISLTRPVRYHLDVIAAEVRRIITAAGPYDPAVILGAAVLVAAVWPLTGRLPGPWLFWCAAADVPARYVARAVVRRFEPDSRAWARHLDDADLHRQPVSFAVFDPKEPTA